MLARTEYRQLLYGRDARYRPGTNVRRSRPFSCCRADSYAFLRRGSIGGRQASCLRVTETGEFDQTEVGALSDRCTA